MRTARSRTPLVAEGLVEFADVGADCCRCDRHPTRLLLPEVLRVRLPAARSALSLAGQASRCGTWYSSVAKTWSSGSSGNCTRSRPINSCVSGVLSLEEFSERGSLHRMYSVRTMAEAVEAVGRGVFLVVGHPAGRLRHCSVPLEEVLLRPRWSCGVGIDAHVQHEQRQRRHLVKVYVPKVLERADVLLDACPETPNGR